MVLSALSDDEYLAVARLATQLGACQGANQRNREYYEGEQLVRQFGISVPPTMRSLRAVAGWGGTTVDVLEERLDLVGWRGDVVKPLGLDVVFEDNQLDVDAGLVTLDALIFGLGFAVVGSGAPGEPEVLVTAHSPESTTALWDERQRRVTSALSIRAEDGPGSPAGMTLYLPDVTLTLEPGPVGWVVVDRDEHRLGRVPVVMFPNRTRGSRRRGRSEITKAVKYYTDAAVRTLLGMEVHREFYSAPQRYALGVDEGQFVDPQGRPVSQWTSIMGRVWSIPRDEDGELPQVGQFTSASPAPYMDQVRGWAQLLSAEAGFPASYLGIQTDNPASADAIRAGEARLVKRAERRQRVFGQGWLEVARLATLILHGEVPPEFRDVSTRWRDAATPTRAASADEATKLIGAGVLPADSTVTYDRVGLAPDEQTQIEADRRRAGGRAVLEALVNSGAQ